MWEAANEGYVRPLLLWRLFFPLPGRLRSFLSSRCCGGRKFHRDGGGGVLVRPRTFRRHHRGRGASPREGIWARTVRSGFGGSRPKGGGLHLGSRVAGIEDKQVRLQGGDQIDADIVVVGIGVEPRLQLAEAAGLALDRGVLVNSRLQTTDPNIFAAGDIARWPDPHTGESIRVEHWVVAERQGQVAAANMLDGDEPFTAVPFFWTKHFDLSFRYVGHAEKCDEVRVEGDLARRDGLVRFRRAGTDLAVATVERDKESLRAELTMEGEFRRSS